MRLIVLVVALGFVLGLTLGGSFNNIGNMRLRLWWLAFIGFAMQAFPYPDGWGRVIPIVFLLMSLVLILAFALANIRAPGFALITLGVLLNMLVISINWGMPVSAKALIDSGQEDVLRELEREESQKHHLATGEDHLRFLGDVIALPKPIGLAVSAGDVAMYAGVILLLGLTMRRNPNPVVKADPTQRGV